MADPFPALPPWLPPCLDDEQKARAYAVLVAARAMAGDGRTKGDPVDVVSLASYIVTGEDPYEVDATVDGQPVLPFPPYLNTPDEQPGMPIGRVVQLTRDMMPRHDHEPSEATTHAHDEGPADG